MLTIVIPSYNHEKYIYECLSAASQVSISGLKILVIDDGSTDNTPAVIKEFIDNNQNINIELVEKKNSGLVSSLNLALELVETEYMYICASDDVPDPQGVKVVYDKINAEKSFDFILGMPRILNNKEIGKKLYGETHKLFLKSDPVRRYRECFFNYPNPLLIQSTIFKAEYLRKLGGWPPNIQLDDMSLFIRIFEKQPVYNRNFLLSDEDIVLYRQHAENSFKNIERQFNIVYETLDILTPEKYRKRALANCKASYIISSVKRKNLIFLKYIFMKGGFSDLFFVVYYAVLKFLKKGLRE